MITASRSLSEVFLKCATARFSAFASLPVEWTGPESNERRILRIPKNGPEGFDIQLTIETYGIYPSAGGWIGSPCPE